MTSEGINLGERCAATSIPAEAKIRPLRDHIVVKPIDWEPSKVLAVVRHGRPLRGIVCAVGPGCYPWRYNSDRSKRWESKAFRRTQVKVGDVVELGGLENGGYSHFTQILWGNELHLVCREEDVCGIANE